MDGDVVQVKDGRDEWTGKDYVAREKTDGSLKVIDRIEDSREEGVKEDCEVETRVNTGVHESCDTR